MSVKRTNSFKKLWTDRQIRVQARSHLLKQRTALSIDLQPLPQPHGQIKHAAVDSQAPDRDYRNQFPHKNGIS